MTILYFVNKNIYLLQKLIPKPPKVPKVHCK